MQQKTSLFYSVLSLPLAFPICLNKIKYGYWTCTAFLTSVVWSPLKPQSLEDLASWNPHHRTVLARKKYGFSSLLGYISFYVFSMLGHLIHAGCLEKPFTSFPLWVGNLELVNKGLLPFLDAQDHISTLYWCFFISFLVETV